MLDRFESLFSGLPPFVGFLITASFPFVALAGLLLAYRANRQRRPRQVVLFGAITFVALLCTALWTMISWNT